MMRLLASTLAVLMLASAPAVTAQSSLFGSRGLGQLGRGLATAALGTQGADRAAAFRW